MESAANKLQKEAKGYLDALRGMSNYQISEMLLFLTVYCSNDGLANEDCRDY